MAVKIVKAVDKVRYEAQIVYYVEYKERKKLYLIFDRDNDDFIIRNDRRIRMPRRVIIPGLNPRELFDFFSSHNVERCEWRLIEPCIVSKDEAEIFKKLE